MIVRVGIIATALLAFTICSVDAAIQAGDRHGVTFEFIAKTSLVVVPVTINGYGPYRFLLDTGATNTILSSTVANTLGIPRRRADKLLTAGGDIPVTIRLLTALNVGAAHLENIEIAVADFGLFCGFFCAPLFCEVV